MLTTSKARSTANDAEDDNDTAKRNKRLSFFNNSKNKHTAATKTQSLCGNNGNFGGVTAGSHCIPGRNYNPRKPTLANYNACCPGLRCSTCRRGLGSENICLPPPYNCR